jgi:hypothetical protein
VAKAALGTCGIGAAALVAVLILLHR